MKKQVKKPIIFLNIDSLLAEPLQVAIQTGKAPALHFLMEKGHFIPDMVSSFPTMSVTIDSTLLTGTYPDQHQIPGLNWFDWNRKKMVNYGTGIRETVRLGFTDSLTNMFYRLNNQDLSKKVTTIYEDLNQHGLTSASINSFVYRGNIKQDMTVPSLLRSISKLDQQITTSAPPLFSLGGFTRLRRWGYAPQMLSGNYKFAGRELRYLIRRGLLPSFTFCIFQDMDFRVHFKGPYDLKGISKIDKEIQKTLNLYSSWEEAIEKNIWIVIGDNGQSKTSWNYNQVTINLRKILKGLRVNKIQSPVHSKDQIVLSVNQRMAYIYVLDERIPLSQIAGQLKTDKRIDVIAWKEGEDHIVMSGTKKGRLKFTPGGNEVDVYNQSWNVEGDLDILNIKRRKDERLTYDDFPDALARLYGALNSHVGRFIVVNAKPGTEFRAQSTPFHLAGACHGSLHKQESLIPCLITGVDDGPEYSRLVNVKEVIIRNIVGEMI
ncbi:alkaline phosphatase family protein [Alkalibacillus aidingensis]|uniref:alkaline phosphatase family protein n=1 Tax=Alkalibacillus aidingensis TaxID=2747607 RepID=UPI00166010BE|nr:alkaline phosphatase family protein [Alkalibacillus aidingensis]